MFKHVVIKLLKKQIPLKEEEINNLIEVPNTELGDYAFPCFKLSKHYKKSPEKISKELALKIEKDLENSVIEKAIAVKGYLNFFVKKEILGERVLKETFRKKRNFGQNFLRKGQKVMLEYSGPNSNKPLHLGHLRNDSIGMAISNVLEFSAHKVIKTNIINDRGVHVCKIIYAYIKWGKNRNPQKVGIKPDHFIGELYVLYEKHKTEESEKEVQELLRKWEKKETEVRKVWHKLTEWALSGMKQTYKTFGSHFDLWPRESEFYDKAGPIIKEGLRKGIFVRNEKGDIVAKLESHGLPSKVVLRADGTSIYLTNDLALTKHRFEKYKLDRMIWVVASEQNTYFKQLFKIFELLGYKWAKNCHHLSYGLVNLPSGRMKSRKGNVVDADDLIEELTRLAEKEILKREPKIKKSELEKRARNIALAAIKFYLLKIDPNKNLLFDPEKAISFEGETGPYIQYAYARASSILRKAGKKVSFNKGVLRLKEK